MVNIRLFGVRKALMLLGAGWVMAPAAAAAQGLEDQIRSITGTGSVFTSVTHTEVDRGSSTDSTTEPSLGVSGNVAGELNSGANNLQLQYGGSLETSRDLPSGDQTENSAIRGAARFTYFDPTQPVDFNLGHTVQSVRNNTGFVVDPANYDTRNELTAGAGVRVYPGELSYLRLSAQAGQSFGGGTLNDDRSETLSGQFVRRLDERSEGSLNASRSWSETTDYDLTIDTVQVVYQRRTESGFLRGGVGQSQGTTEFRDGGDIDSDAVTGFLERGWQTDEATTRFRYERRLSDSAAELSLNEQPVFGFLEDTVRTHDLVVSDSVLVSHDTRNLCDACTFGVGLEASVLESELIGATTHEYRGRIGLGIQLTGIERVYFDYDWQADAGENGDVIQEQVHRFTMGWSRLLAENTTFGVELFQSYLNSRLDRPDEDEYALRFVLTRGFSLQGVR
ncbi:hypothetical protein BTO32_02960 [Marinobacter lutaoensis]|uniref:Uncharacterized protein n=1 Tax=Marinobacter lutaoensis TaxID=135739 RepID=A0A1V2DYC9_9GAMM|nr:hypothetical protein [Marinobacter lutaoensis]ONF45430.1 hypothetical protein BTO32_02960 [Marinobacter lutaoensis]